MALIVLTINHRDTEKELLRAVLNNVDSAVCSRYFFCLITLCLCASVVKAFIKGIYHRSAETQRKAFLTAVLSNVGSNGMSALFFCFISLCLCASVVDFKFVSSFLSAAYAIANLTYLLWQSDEPSRRRY